MSRKNSTQAVAKSKNTPVEHKAFLDRSKDSLDRSGGNLP